MNQLKIVFIMFCLVSCSHAPKKLTDNYTDNVRQIAEQKAVAVIKKAKQRKPASQELANLKIQIEDLRKVSPGKFEIYVYPKLSNRNEKVRNSDEILIGKPQVFEFSALAISECKNFIEGDLFEKYSPKNYFPTDKALGNQKCAIVELTSKNIRTANRSLLTKGDALKQRLYLDEEYRLYGYETDIYINGQNLETIRVVSTGQVPSTSGLSLFPVDLPLIEELQSDQIHSLTRITGQWIDELAVAQVRRRHNRQFRVPECQAAQFIYEDYYGHKTNVSWCRGMPWPSYSETERFVSVTQELKVR